MGCFRLNKVLKWSATAMQFRYYVSWSKISEFACSLYTVLITSWGMSGNFDIVITCIWTFCTFFFNFSLSFLFLFFLQFVQGWFILRTHAHPRIHARIQHPPYWTNFAWTNALFYTRSIMVTNSLKAKCSNKYYFLVNMKIETINEGFWHLAFGSYL